MSDRRAASVAQLSTRRYIGQHSSARAAWRERTGGQGRYPGSSEHRRVEKRRKQWIRDELRRREAARERERIERIRGEVEAVDIAGDVEEPRDELGPDDLEDAGGPDAPDVDDEPLQIVFPEGPYWDMLSVDIIREDAIASADAGQELFFWSEDLGGDLEFIGNRLIDVELYVSGLYSDASQDSKNFQQYAYYQWVYVEKGGQSHYIIRRTDLVNGKAGYTAKEST